MILVKIWAGFVSQVKAILKADGRTEPTFEDWARAKAPFRRSDKIDYRLYIYLKCTAFIT